MKLNDQEQKRAKRLLSQGVPAKEVASLIKITRRSNAAVKPRKSIVEKFGDFGKNTADTIGGFIGTKQFGEFAGKTINEGIDLAGDIARGENTDTGFDGQKEFIKGASGAAQLAVLPVGGGLIGSATTKAGTIAATSALGAAEGVLGDLADTGRLSANTAVSGLTGAALAPAALAIPGAAKATGKVINAGRKKITSLKDVFKGKIPEVKKILGKGKEELTDRLSPKLTPKERTRAIKDGRVVEGKNNILTGKALDKISASDSVKSSVETVKEQIPNYEKLNDFELVNAMNDKTSEISNKLRPDLQKVRLAKSKKDINKIKKEAEELMLKQADEPEFVAFAGAKKFQERFLRFVDEINLDSNLDDVWDARIGYDDIIPDSVKNASELSSPSLQLQKEMWLENRSLFNDLLKRGEGALPDKVRTSFSDMRNLYEGINNIARKGVIDTKGKDGLLKKAISKENIIKATGIGILGETIIN